MQSKDDRDKLTVRFPKEVMKKLRKFAAEKAKVEARQVSLNECIVQAVRDITT